MLAVPLPEAEEAAAVGVVAVRVHEEFVAVGRQRYEIVERTKISQRPGGQHQNAGEGRRAELKDSTSPGKFSPEKDPRGDHEHGKEQSFAAGQRRQCRHRTHGECPHDGWAFPPAVGEEDDEEGAKSHQAFGEEDAVDQPEVGIDRGQAAGDQSDRLGSFRWSDSPSDEHGHDDHCRADEEREDLVIDVGGSSESRRERENDRIEGSVQRTGDPVLVCDEIQGLGEATTTGEDVGGRVVEERIAAVGSGGSDGEQRRETHDEGASGHHRGAVKESQRRKHATQQVSNGDRADGQYQNCDRRRQDDAPDGRREDRSVERRDLAPRHVDPFDVLASDDVDGRIAEKRSGESESEKRPGRPTESGESTT